MENPGRGLIALPQSVGNVCVGWRLLGTDPEDLAFNLYHATGASGIALIKIYDAGPE